jgi:WD40 repeat protein
MKTSKLNKDNFLHTLVILITFVVLTGCTAPAQPDQTAVATVTAEMMTEQVTPTQATTEIPVLQTAQPSAHPLTGLVYLYDDRLWLVGQNGQPTAILHQASYATPSTDGQRVLYASGDPSDLFMQDLATGEVRQLTNTPNIAESYPHFWPGKPEMVVYHFVNSEDVGISAGFLGAVNVNSREQLVLDAQNSSFSTFALADDGQHIAYGGAKAMIYTWGSGPQQMEMASFSLNLFKVFFDSAAWAPGGQQLAWTIRGEFMGEGDYQAGVVIFDLATHTHWLLHNYALHAGSDFSNAITWSPDGQWLAAALYGDVPGQRSATLWLIQPTSGAEHSVSFASSPVWAPDGLRLVYTQWPDPAQGNFTAQDARIILMQTGSWTTEALSLPPGSIVMDWIKR